MTKHKVLWDTHEPTGDKFCSDCGCWKGNGHSAFCLEILMLRTAGWEKWEERYKTSRMRGRLLMEWEKIK